MNRRSFLTLGLGTAGAVALGACGGSGEPSSAPTTLAAGASPAGLEPVPRPTLRLPGQDFGFPSPFAYMRGAGYLQMSYIYDTLLWKDATGELIPWLANSYEVSMDGLAYTFELRDGIRWSDGTPLTAEDVAFTFEYFASQQLSPQVIVRPTASISEVSASGATTVEFRLENPDATFLGFGGAGAVPIVPRHIWSSISDASQALDPAVLVGSGPYRLESYARGEGSYLYTANDDYFLGRPFVQRIENLPVGDELTALLGGELDMASVRSPRPEVLAPFRANDALGLLESDPGVTVQPLYWNLAKGGALADPVFRKACARAFDREDAVERLFGGNAAPGNPGWIPPGNPFHVEVEQYGFDPAAANQMLDDAGYTQGDEDIRQGPDGQPLRFSLLVANAPVSPVVDLLVGAMAAIGVELRPEAVDRPTLNQRMIAGDTEMSVIISPGVSSDLSPDYMRLVYSSDTRLTQHAQGYANAEFDELAQQQLRTLDREERMEIVARMQEIVAEDLPVLPLYYENEFAIFNEAVFDQWYYTPGGVFGVNPRVENKQAFVTGLQTGVEIRPTE